MSQAAGLNTQPENSVSVTIGIRSDLLALIADPDGKTQRLAALTDDRFRGLLDTIGIKAKVRLEFRVARTKQTLAARVNGFPVSYSPHLVRTLWQSYAPSEAQALAHDFSLDDWTREAASRDFLLRAKFIALLVVEIVKQNPDRLLPEGPLFSGIAEQFGVAEADHEPLRAVLRQILQQRVSLADRGLVREQLRAGLADGMDADEIAEALITRLHTKELRIAVHPDYLADLIGSDDLDEPLSVQDSRIPDSVRELLTQLSEGMFYELGIRVPTVILEPAPWLPECCFAVKINHLFGAVHRGLGLENRLVNEIPGQLAVHGVIALPGINPANQKEASIIREEEWARIPKDGRISWNAFEYVVLVCAAELRKFGGAILDNEIVELELARLQEAGFPDLVLATIEAISIPRLTHILRALLRQEVSIRDLPAILDGILQFHHVVLSEEPHLASRADCCLEHVRGSLRSYISHKYTRGQNVMDAYLLDPQIEELIMQYPAEPVERAAAQIEAIQAAIRDQATASDAVILTTADAASGLRELLKDEFRHLPVLAYQELSPDLNVRPLARISLSSA